METKKKDDRKLLGSQIEDRILEYIKEKPLEVGDRLPNEFELAEMFEVGRSTIREAVKGLVTKGVLQVRRGAGTYVSSLTPAEDDPLRLNAKLHDRFKLALDLFDVRLILEPEIAAKAAVYATDEDIATLKRLCKETEELYLADKDHMPKDIEFHTWIARCSKNQVMFGHVLKNAMMPVITFLGMMIAEILAGSIVVEQVFALPGIGRLLISSVGTRDLPVVEILILYITFVVIFVYFIVDILYRVIDPRIRRNQ